jgi:2-polyprenyl-3-methyl-5-hydroxy-6-metoxy-1,4-benzoquinol methylase
MDESIHKTAVQYWNQEWVDRDKGRYTKCNGGKFKFVNEQLNSRASYIAPLETLEIGCGSGLHIKTLAFDHPEWAVNYTGIDLSENAVHIANRWGLNAEVGSIYDFKSDKKFELFLFLDVLEHIGDYNKTSKQIKKLAADKFCVIGNVPLYLSHSEDGAYEREMNVAVLAEFLNMVGFKQFAHIVYGINGWPYMWFEAQ